MTPRIRPVDPELRAKVIEHVETCTGQSVPDCPWNVRSIRCGLAYAKTHTRTGAAIELAIAPAPWKHFTDAERWTALVHECCHLLNPWGAHGPEWRNSMISCGESTSRVLISPTLEAYLLKRATQHLLCDCSEGVYVTPQKLTAMRKKGMGYYRCTHCNAILSEERKAA